MRSSGPATSRPLAAVMAVAMAAFSLVFAGLGLAALAGQVPGIPRPLGLLIIAIAAIGIPFLQYFIPLALNGREPGQERQVGKVREQGIGSSRTTTYARRGNVALTILGYAGLIAFMAAALVAGLVMLPFLPIALLLAAIVVPSAIAGIRSLLENPAALQLTTSGLTIPVYGFIPWRDIERLAIEDLYPVMSAGEGGESTRVIGSTRQLGVHVRSSAEPAARGTLDRYTRGLGRVFMSLAAGGGLGTYAPIAVAERDLPVPLEEVLETAEAYRLEATTS